MKSLFISQGVHTEKIVASILVNQPEKVIFIRSKQDYDNNIKTLIDNNMLRANEYLAQEDHMDKLREYTEIRVEFFQFPIALKEIHERLEEERDIFESKGHKINDIIVDISSGPPLIQIAMYLAAQLVGLPEISFGFSGERYFDLEKSSKEYEITITKEKIEFVKNSRVKMPHLPLKLQPLPFDILSALSKQKGGKVLSLQELISHMGGTRNPANSMSVGRNLTLLRDYGYVSEKKVGKQKEIKITELGKEMLDLKNSPIILELKTRLQKP